jgi:DNA modification methylase
LQPGTNKKAHPCQMPEALAVRCIVFSTDKGDTVYDPFMGSGTTTVACCLTRRNFIGSEEEREYFELANNRLQCGQFSYTTSRGFFHRIYRSAAERDKQRL